MIGQSLTDTSLLRACFENGSPTRFELRDAARTRRRGRLRYVARASGLRVRAASRRSNPFFKTASKRLAALCDLSARSDMNIRYGLLALLAPMVACGAELPSSPHTFVVIAHRGNHSRAHENTLTALQAAIDAGVDFAEIDVRRTADGHYVLMHDRTVERMTDGHGAVKDLTLAQLQKLRVLDRKRPQIPSDRVATFVEALKLIKGRLNIYLDFKEGDRKAVAGAIREAGVTKQVLVYDGAESISEWRRVAAELPLIISLPDEAKTAQQMLDFATRNRVEVLDGSWEDYSEEKVKAARGTGVRIWPDIQGPHEDGTYFEKVLRMGFSGVQTDHPEELIGWLNEHHMR